MITNVLEHHVNLVKWEIELGCFSKMKALCYRLPPYRYTMHWDERKRISYKWIYRGLCCYHTQSETKCICTWDCLTVPRRFSRNITVIKA